MINSIHPSVSLVRRNLTMIRTLSMFLDTKVQLDDGNVIWINHSLTRNIQVMHKHTTNLFLQLNNLESLDLFKDKQFESELERKISFMKTCPAYAYRTIIHQVVLFRRSLTNIAVDTPGLDYRHVQDAYDIVDGIFKESQDEKAKKEAYVVTKLAGMVIEDSRSEMDIPIEVDTREDSVMKRIINRVSKIATAIKAVFKKPKLISILKSKSSKIKKHIKFKNDLVAEKLFYKETSILEEVPAPVPLRRSTRRRIPRKLFEGMVGYN